MRWVSGSKALQFRAVSAAALLLAMSALGQDAPPGTPPAPVASALPSVFAGFPTPRTDLPFLEPVWPSRRTGGAARGVIIPLENPEQFPDGHRLALPLPMAASAPEVRAIIGEKPVPEGIAVSRGGAGSFHYSLKRADPDKPVPRSRRNTAAAMFKFVSAQEEQSARGPELVLEQTWFAVYEPDVGQAPRGIALVSPGLLGTPLGTLQSLSNELRKEGWVVLRMLCQPSRFTEQVEFKLDASQDLDEQARRIAEVTGNRTAECAYAVKAAMSHLESERPDLRAMPRVAVGFSGGAMTLPTIIAREPERYAAMIMVGGGADFWLMNQRSNYRDLIRAVKETWKGGEKPEADVLARLDEAYLKQAPLDSYHTAAALRGKRVLMIQGTADKAVPAPLGDVLWERLGKPERWLVEGATHESLFMNLPRDEFPRMMEWLNRACPKPADDLQAEKPKEP
jgi:predicted esterase